MDNEDVDGDCDDDALDHDVDVSMCDAMRMTSMLAQGTNYASLEATRK